MHTLKKHALIGIPDILYEGVNRGNTVIKELTYNVRARDEKLQFIEIFAFFLH